MHQINEKKEPSNDTVNQVLPGGQLFALGFQHVLAMYAGAVTVPLLVGASLKLSAVQIAMLVAADLFTCGIATLIQSLGIGKTIGIRLPAILGCSFAVVTPLITIGTHYGMPYAYGAILVAGLFVFLVAPLFGEILRFFPHVVIGSIVTVIGLSLLPVAAQNIGGGSGKSFGNVQNLILAGIVVLIIVMCNKVFTGFLRSISVLVGIVLGTIIGGFMGMVNMTPVLDAKWFGLVHPFMFGVPKFSASPILLMIVVMIITMIESTGTYLGIGKVVQKEVDKKEIVKGLRAEGIATIIGGIFNSFSYTAFNQNLGLLSLSKAVSRYITAVSGIILIALGLCPKFAAFATIIPTPVIGGATIIMFALVAVAGFNMLRNVDFTDSSNMLIVACSVGIGLGVTTVPTLFDKTPMVVRTIFGGSGIVSATFVAVFLNLLLHHLPIGKKAEKAPASSTEPIED